MRPIYTMASLLFLISVNSAFSEPTKQPADSALEARIKELEAKVDKLSERTFVSAPAFKDIQITGRLHIDSKWYDNRNSGDSKKDGIDIRTARLGVRGALNKDFNYRFENDFTNNSSRITDAFIAYVGIQDTELKIGQFRPPISLERLISNNNITFMERSIALYALPERTVGFQVSNFGDNWQLAAAIFGESTGNENRNDDSRYFLNARTSYAPINKNNNLLHLGLALASISEDRSRSANSNNASPFDTKSILATELAATYGSLNFQGEYIIENVKYDQSSPNAGQKTSIDSFYIQTSYFLSGDSREYNPKLGMFTGTKIINPVDKGGIGAWEVALRYSKNNSYAADAINNVVPPIIKGKGESTESIAGVNWYLNNNMRIMANYSMVKVDKNTASNEKYNLFAIRTQVNF